MLGVKHPLASQKQLFLKASFKDLLHLAVKESKEPSGLVAVRKEQQMGKARAVGKLKGGLVGDDVFLLQRTHEACRGGKEGLRQNAHGSKAADALFRPSLKGGDLHTDAHHGGGNVSVDAHRSAVAVVTLLRVDLFLKGVLRRAWKQTVKGGVYRLKVAFSADGKHHIVGTVVALVGIVKTLRGHFFHRARRSADIVLYGALLVKSPQKGTVKGVSRIVHVHIDLLDHDALFLVHVFLGEIGGEHAFKKDLQPFLHLLGGRKEVAGALVGGIGVGVCRKAGKLQKGILAVGVFKHFML